MSKKIILIVSVLVLSIHLSAQHLETTIKVVSGKARIAIKAVGGTLTGYASNYVMVVGIPKANGDAGAVLNTPVKLDVARTSANPVVTLPAYDDATYKYFLLFYTGTTTDAGPSVFEAGEEYDILELTWSGPSQSFPVSLMSLPDGNPATHIAQSQWQHYLEIGGKEVSTPRHYFYQSATSTSPVNGVDYSTGTAIVTTSSRISTGPSDQLINLSGFKSGSKNVLNWIAAGEINCRGYDVQRSTDGINYSSVGFVNSQATGGFSNSQLNYTFDDNNPIGKKQYYRLNQENINSAGKLSNTIVINGDRSTILAIGGLFPNPASTKVNVIIDAPQQDKVTVIVTDMSGKIVKQQQANVGIGSNTVPVDVAILASGSYLVKLICQSSDCETATAKFNKQ